VVPGISTLLPLLLKLDRLYRKKSKNDFNILDKKLIHEDKRSGENADNKQEVINRSLLAQVE
jgi:hypothetical protein